MKYIYKQIIIGIIFGCISIAGTEYGIPFRGVMVNCRDAAPLAAGFLFGGPAGIIAGLMGGIERWFAVYWGVGSFTRVACSVSTALAGFFAALLRKFLFENEKPTYGMALGCGAVMEVFHLNMIFVTNASDAESAIFVINICFIPMVIANSVSVMLSVIAIALLSKEKLARRSSRKETPIFQTIQRWLLIVLSISFFISSVFTFFLQNNMSNNNAVRTVKNTCNEISQVIIDASDNNMLYTCRIVGREIASGYYNIDNIAEKYELTEILVIDKNGIVVESNNPDYIGFDMASGDQSAAFLCLLNGTKEYVQEYGPIAKNSSEWRKFAGVAIKGGFVQISYDKDTFQKEIYNKISFVADNKTLGHDGGVIITDGDNVIISSTKGVDSIYKNITPEQLSMIRSSEEPAIITLEDESQYYVACNYSEGYYIISLYNYEDAVSSRDVSLYLSVFSLVIIFAIMFALIYFLIKKIVVNQISKMTQSLSIISQGNLNEVVDVRSSSEFSSLSDDINSTVNTLKRYIEEAASRIDAELKFAKTIQESALPNVFPERDDFEIYATMKTAKEVGGDFYDFYFTDSKTLNFLIADVSGKGIPAAMFMMRAKSVLKAETQRGSTVDKVFSEGNDSLCQGNDAGMFVTAWQGCFDLENGKIQFSNAGHNYPAIKRKNGKFELAPQKVNLVLGGMEGLPYAINDLQLEPGDSIFLYTDGVTEATNAENELFGNDRLLDALNSKDFANPQEVCDAVYKSIDDFVLAADQFDDITMLCVTYKAHWHE